MSDIKRHNNKVRNKHIARVFTKFREKRKSVSKNVERKAVKCYQIAPSAENNHNVIATENTRLIANYQDEVNSLWNKKSENKALAEVLMF